MAVISVDRPVSLPVSNICLQSLELLFHLSLLCS